jgi:tripartite-type tricarboxylate transporter receptor subunit TctC
VFGVVTMMRSQLGGIALGILAFAGVSAPGAVTYAQIIDQGFAGKTVTILVGYGPGGGYDLYGRVLARHLPRYLPGIPNVIVSNMPGAASVRAANYLFNVAPRDGSVLGIAAQSIAEEQLLGTTGVSFDVARFNWIGRIASNVEVSYVWHTSKVTSIWDLMSQEATFAGTGPSSQIYPRLLNSIAGMKWKVVVGYNTTADGHLALERGEVDGATSSLNTLKTTQADWLSRGLVRVLVQYARERSPDLAEVPAVVEFGHSAEDTEVLRFYANSGEVGRSVMAPPGVPSARLAMLRAAFDATMKDAEFLAEIKKTNLELRPIDGATLQALVESASHVSAGVLARAKAARAE